MRILKRILLVLLGLWLAYVAYLYIASPKVTYLIRKGYEGPLVIVANQKDGIEINRNHAVYDFTKSNLIKLKGDLLTGFFPWGYLNYYSVDENGEKEKMQTIDDAPENSTATEDKIYVWGYYYTSGGCETDGNKTYYESLVVSKKSNTTKIVSEKNKLINKEVCNKKAAQ